MKSDNTNSKKTSQSESPSEKTTESAYQKLPVEYRPKAGYSQRDPIHYKSHPHPSMKRFAEFLVLQFDKSRTRHSYYRQMRLVHEFCKTDPEKITEQQFRNYILYIKTIKHWKPKTIRQAAAGAKLFLWRWRLIRTGACTSNPSATDLTPSNI